jgi:hypothetical protein
MKSIYFSYAYTIPKEWAEAIKIKLTEVADVEVLTYQKGTEYSDLPIRQCDAFVVNLTNNSFESLFSALSPGVQKELVLAVSLKKDIILARVEDDHTYLYLSEVNFKDRKIKAVVNTEEEVIRLLNEPPKKEEVNTELDWLQTPKEDIIL